MPNHVDIFLLRREMPPSEKTALQSVIEVDAERLRLEREAEILGSRDDPGEGEISTCRKYCPDLTIDLAPEKLPLV